MRRPFIPEPVGLDDPTKQAAGHTERIWEALATASSTTSACVVAAVVAGAAVVAPVAPFFAVFAAVAGGLKMRARWAREDPPRLDFDVPVGQPRRRVDVTPILGPQYQAGGRLTAAVDAGDAYLAATVGSVEKALGAGQAAQKMRDYEIVALANRRLLDATYYAQLTRSVLVAVHQESEGFASELLEHGLPDLAPTSADDLLDAMDDATLGLVLSTNVDLEFLHLKLGQGVPSAELLAEMCRDAGASARDLGEALDTWASATQDSLAETPQLYGD